MTIEEKKVILPVPKWAEPFVLDGERVGIEGKKMSESEAKEVWEEFISQKPFAQ